MILKDTILSAFTDRLTLMKWLKKVEQALKESVLVDIQVNQTDAQHMTMTFVFEDGAQIATPVITLPKGEQGPQGTTTKVSVGNTYTVDSNTPAMVQDVQSGDDVVLEFTIPRGERGPQGPKGDPGDGATGIDQLKNFVWPVGGTVTSAAAGADGVTYVGSASLKVGSGEAEETFEVPGILHIPLVGSDTIVIDATEDGKKVEIHLDAAVVAKLQKALTLPTETPSSFSLIGVGTNGAQRNATLGEGLGINSGNQIHVQAGAGLQIDSTDKTVAVNPGGGLTIDGGQLAVNVGSGLSISSSGALQATGGGSGGTQLYLHKIEGGLERTTMYIVTTGMNAITQASTIADLYAMENDDNGVAIQGYISTVPYYTSSARAPSPSGEGAILGTSVAVEPSVIIYYLDDTVAEQASASLDVSEYPFTDTVTPL